MDILSRHSRSNSLGFRRKSLACLTGHSSGMQLEVTVYLNLHGDICRIDRLPLLLRMALCDAWPEL